MKWTHHSARRLGTVVAAGLLFAACGQGGGAASVDPGPRPDLAVIDPAASTALPAVTVWDVGAKEWVQFANFLPAEKPVLIWLWAPH